MLLFSNKTLLTFFVLIFYGSITQPAEEERLLGDSSSIPYNSSTETLVADRWKKPKYILDERSKTPPIEEKTIIIRSQNQTDPGNKCCLYMQLIMISGIVLTTVTMTTHALSSHHLHKHNKKYHNLPTGLPTKFNSIDLSLRGPIDKNKNV